jgi:hypothetical protein
LFTSRHIPPAVIELLSTARVRVVVVTFAPQPYTTQIFQVLDLTLFRVLKRRGEYQLSLEDDPGGARFIGKVHHDHDLRMMMIEPNIWGAFRGIGVKHSVVDGLQRVSLDEMTLPESQGLTELWDINLPVGICRQDARAARLVGSISRRKMVWTLLLRISMTGLDDSPLSKTRQNAAVESD